MKTICFYFEIHQMFHLKRYRFFDINADHYYYDDYANETGIEEVAEKSYMPALSALKEMIRQSNGSFRFALGISGVALDQLEMHAPDVIEMLQELAATGCCEFVAQPYSYGLSSLKDVEGFKDEVKRQCSKIRQLFGRTPSVFANSNMIYSDEIGAVVAGMGFKGMFTEGAKHILGWKSPHYVYNCNLAPNLKLLLRDFNLSDDISLRFSNPDWSEYPLFADKYIAKIAAMPEAEQVINICMDLSAFGMAQPLSSNILEFLKAIPACAAEKSMTFSTPSEIIAGLAPASSIDVPYPISWCDEERDTSPWEGNVMQREALDKLYGIAERVRLCNNRLIKQDWDCLQACDNFHYMTTKNSGIAVDRGIFDSPFDAFTNYMNILADFVNRVNELFPEGMDNEEINSYTTVVNNQNDEIKFLKGRLDTANCEIAELKQQVEKLRMEEKPKAEAEEKPAPRKAARAKKTSAK